MTWRQKERRETTKPARERQVDPSPSAVFSTPNPSYLPSRNALSLFLRLSYLVPPPSSCLRSKDSKDTLSTCFTLKPNEYICDSKEKKTKSKIRFEDKPGETSPYLPLTSLPPSHPRPSLLFPTPPPPLLPHSMNYPAARKVEMHSSRAHRVTLPIKPLPTTRSPLYAQKKREVPLSYGPPSPFARVCASQLRTRQIGTVPSRSLRNFSGKYSKKKKIETLSQKKHPPSKVTKIRAWCFCLVVGVALEPSGNTLDLASALVHDLRRSGTHEVLADLVVHKDDHLFRFGENAGGKRENRGCREGKQQE